MNSIQQSLNFQIKIGHFIHLILPILLFTLHKNYAMLFMFLLPMNLANWYINFVFKEESREEYEYSKEKLNSILMIGNIAITIFITTMFSIKHSVF